MPSMLKSATKLVFLMIAIALIAALFTKLIDPKDFMVIASMVFVYYFTKPANTPTV